MLKINRFSVQIMGEASALLIVALGVLAYFSHRALRNEAMNGAEQILEATVQDIDNILLNVEQTAGNVYNSFKEHMDNPENAMLYSRELVENNPNIAGCAIAFRPGFYQGKDLYMAYARRNPAASAAEDEVTMASTFARRPYTEQAWFNEAMKTDLPKWTNPLKGGDTDGEPLVCFTLPLYDKQGEHAGVMAVFLSIQKLSKIVLAAKPSQNGYGVLLANNGAYIVHPDKQKLFSPMAFIQKDQSLDLTVIEAAESMLAGEQGMKEFKREGKNWCVFYEPFERQKAANRAEGKIGWSVGVVYPEEDVFDPHQSLISWVLIIAAVSLLLFFITGSWIIRQEMKPLRYISAATRQIIAGNYSQIVPKTDREDEIGDLQNQFAAMQLTLKTRAEQLEAETLQLQRDNIALASESVKTTETGAMKTKFMKHLTTQMTESTDEIYKSVTTLYNNSGSLSREDIARHAEIIKAKSKTMAELMDMLDHFTTAEAGKEVGND